MTKCLAQILPLMVSFLLITCKDTGVVPEELKPGRRDYVWTVDTLTITDGYFSPSRIWGSASNDVWLACTGSPTRNLLWHFDGTKWVNDATPRPIDPSALFGFSSNCIWLGNAGDSFWKFNGSTWYEYSKIQSPGYWTAVEDIWGARPSDLWGVGFSVVGQGDGYEARVFHCDGNTWESVQIPTIHGNFVGVRAESGIAGTVFIDSWREGPLGDSCKVYAYQRLGGIREIYAGQTEMTIEDIQGGIYFVNSQKIYKYRQGHFELWRDFSSTEYAGWLKGRTEMDLFGVSAGNGIMHYDGTDFKVIYPNKAQVANLVVLSTAVIAVCYDVQSGVTEVIRGNLRE